MRKKGAEIRILREVDRDHPLEKIKINIKNVSVHQDFDSDSSFLLYAILRAVHELVTRRQSESDKK